MKALKILSLTLLLLIPLFTANIVQAQIDDSLENMLVEYEADKITAEELEVAEPEVLPGETGYWWTNLKRNVDLFFTFDQTKKAVKEQKYAGQLLLEAKKLAEKGANGNKLQTALERYKKLKEKLTNRVRNNEQVRNQVMTELDDKEFKQLQLVREISDKVPEEIATKLGEIRDNNAIRWFESNQEQVTTRLERVIEQNNTGSKYQQFKHLATLEEIGDILPEDISDKLELVKVAAQERLAEKLDSFTPVDKDKVEKYIDNINLQPVVKQKMVQNLRVAENLPSAVKTTVTKVASSYAQRTKEKWNNMNIEQKRKFLAQLKNRHHPSYLEFLESIEVPAELKELVDEIKAKQQAGIRAKIQKTNSVQKLRGFEGSLKNNPALINELRERVRKIPVEMPTSSGEERPMLY